MGEEAERKGSGTPGCVARLASWKLITTSRSVNELGLSSALMGSGTREVGPLG